MKRVLSVLMICALLMAGLTSFASAEAASIAITVDKTSYAVGDTVTATVQLNGYAENTWSMMTIAVLYDPEVLQYVSAANKFSSAYLGGLEASNDPVNGILGLAWIGAALPAPGADNAVAELTFTVSKVPESPIQLTAFFVEDGIMLQGEKTQMENPSGDEAIYSAGNVLSDPIVIQPEQPAAPSTGPATLGGQYGVKAEEIPAEGLTYDQIKVAGKYNGDVDYVNTYKVVLTWTDLELTYNDATIKTWNAEIHEWIPNTDNNKWTKGTLIVEVANHSSDDVTVGMTYNDAVGGPVTKAADVEPIPVDAYNEQTKAAGEGTLSSEVSVESGAITKDEGDAAITLGTFTVTVK